MVIGLLKKNKFLMGVFLVALLMVPANIRSYAAVVGDVVKPEEQKVIEGIRYPLDGSTVIAKEDKYGQGCALYFSDGTAILQKGSSGVFGNAAPATITEYAFKALDPSGNKIDVNTIIFDAGVTSVIQNYIRADNVLRYYLSNGISFSSPKVNGSYYRLSSFKGAEVIVFNGDTTMPSYNWSDSHDWPLMNPKSNLRIYLNKGCTKVPANLLDGPLTDPTFLKDVKDLTIIAEETLMGGASKVAIPSLERLTVQGDIQQLSLGGMTNLIVADIPDVSVAGINFLKGNIKLDFSKSRMKKFTVLANGMYENLPVVDNSYLTGVTYIGDTALKGTSVSGEIDLKNITFLGAGAFENTKVNGFTGAHKGLIIQGSPFKNTDLEGTIDLGDMESLGKGAFQSVNLYGTLDISKVSDIGEDSLRSTNITGVSKFAPNTTIGLNALNGSKLMGILDLSNVVRVKGYALSGTNITSVVGTDSIEYMEDYSLSGIPTLTGSLSLSNIKSVGKYSLKDTGITALQGLPGNVALSSYSLANSKLISFECPDGMEILPEGALQDSSVEAIDFGSIKEVGNYALKNTKVSKVYVPSSINKWGTDVLAGCNLLEEIVWDAKLPFDSNVVSGVSNLKKLYILSEVNPALNKSKLSPNTMIYCKEDSSVETWCKNNSVAYKTLTDEELEGILNGKAPILHNDDKYFDFQNPIDLKFKVNLGVPPAGAVGISEVLVDNNTLSSSDYSFNGSDTITIKASYLKTLWNGNHYVSVLFNNGTFKSGATIFVMRSNVPVVDPNKPPEALDTVKYEFYKDYPDYVIIPVSLNGATKVIKLKIGSEVVDEAYYELDEGAIIISYDYLRTLDSGKYRVLPTFNDPAITTLNNIQLYVYENAADRAAPYLLQTRILFKGQNFKLKFDFGLGSLEASNVLALVIDDSMLLQDGTILPFSKSNMTSMQRSFIADIPVASPSEAIKIPNNNEKEVASPSEASKASPSEATMSIMGYVVDLTDAPVPMSNDLSSQAFYVVNNEIYVNGSVVSSMNLEEGDHLIGAIFDNTEKTTDIKKVILSIMSDGGSTDPGNGGTDPGNGGTDPGDGGSTDPGNGGNNGGSNGGNSGGGSGSGGGKNPGGSGSSGGPGNTGEDTKEKPKVPDDGGSLIVNPKDPSDVTYVDKDGNPSPNKWIGDGENWRHTNSESKLDFGWFRDVDGTWYLLNRDTGKDFGATKYGWSFEVQDGKWYYLSTKNTAMLKGWVQIDSNWYYFTEANDGQTYYGDNISGWFYDNTKPFRPLGSMWANETTPDGKFVNASGARQ
jgi:hypothetical protein